MWQANNSTKSFSKSSRGLPQKLHSKHCMKIVQVFIHSSLKYDYVCMCIYEYSCFYDSGNGVNFFPPPAVILDCQEVCT